MMKRCCTSLMFCRFKGGPGDRIMYEPPPFSRPTDPYRQDPQPPHRFYPQPPPNKTALDADFMKYQVKQFELGKRHLANMMGVEVETMTQEDIDRSIQYLLPTGIFALSSRPIMKHPKELFEYAGNLDLDANKRPKSPFFYTPNANFYSMCFLISDAIEKGDEMLRNGEKPAKALPYDGKTQRWVDASRLGKILSCRISDEEMNHFNSLIARLASHPMAAHNEDILNKFRVVVEAQDSKTIPGSHNLQNDTEGFLQKDEFEPVSIARGQKFTARAEVELRPLKEWEKEASVTVNGSLLSDHFDYLGDREQILFPLSVTKMYNKFHIKATVMGGGRSGQSNAVRMALSWALVPFLEEHLVEKLRLSGLLTRDIRRRERQKIGQHGPRRKKQFRKR